MNLDLDGVYLPSFNTKLNLAQINVKEKFSIIGSAHSIKEIRIKEKQGVELLFLSPLFKTKTNKKVIALGGITSQNLNKLKMINAFGFAGITIFKNIDKVGIQNGR